MGVSQFKIPGNKYFQIIHKFRCKVMLHVRRLLIDIRIIRVTAIYENFLYSRIIAGQDYNFFFNRITALILAWIYCWFAHLPFRFSGCLGGWLGGGGGGVSGGAWTPREGCSCWPVELRRVLGWRLGLVGGQRDEFDWFWGSESG